jgi:hypothetical protein
MMANEPAGSQLVLQLLVHGVRPILAVPKGAPSKLSNYLVALSGSLDSAGAMKQLLQMKLSPKANVHVVTAGSLQSEESTDELISKARKYCEFHGHNTTGTILDKNGFESIFSEAERVDADLISIGSSYKKFLFKGRFGVNAKAILDRSPIAIFVSN